MSNKTSETVVSQHNVTEIDETSARSVEILPGRPNSLLEVEEPVSAVPNDEDSITYPTGLKLWLSIISIMLSCLCYGLDMTMVAPTVPSVTNEFRSIGDIGWYSAVYGLVGSSLTFFWSRCYSLFNVKSTYLSTVVIFELGALLATVARSSNIFILARAISGCGGAGMSTGSFLILVHCFPNHKRPMWNGIVAMVQTAAMVVAPLVGGALIDTLSWRACYGINLPLGALALAMIWFGFTSPITNAEESLPLKEKIKKLDPVGTIIIVPAISCLLLALQWGGMTYSWSSPRIIILLVLSAVLIAAFGCWQIRLGEDAMLPPRILKNRNVLAAAWFEACCDGVLAITEVYISVYFQGVRGFTAFKSGYLFIPMIIGVSSAAMFAGISTSVVGYYTRKSKSVQCSNQLTCIAFMVVTSVLAPIASGLLAKLDLDTQLAKCLGLLAFIGISVGLGIGAPHAAISTVLDIKDVPIATGILGFVARLVTAVVVSSSATLFQNRLSVEVAHTAPGQNTTVLRHVGLSDIRTVIGQDKLRDVLLGYGEAVSQTLYMPVALACLSIVGTASMEWRSVKKKTD